MDDSILREIEHLTQFVLAHEGPVDEDELRKHNLSTICICGGGNGAHVFAVRAASLPNKNVRVLTLYADEHVRWTKAMNRNGGTSIRYDPSHGVDSHVLKSRPQMVTNDPQQAIPGANVFILAVPAFAHGQYLKAISEYSDRPAIIAVFPGAGGLEYQFLNYFGERAPDYALIAADTLPWACRIIDYGSEVEVLGTKHTIGISALIHDQREHDSLDILQHIVGDIPVLRDKGNILASSLGQVNPMAHPEIMYAHWKDWDGQGLDEKPLFYHGMSAYAAELMEQVCDECIAIADAVKAVRPDLQFEMMKLLDWTVDAYGDDIDDPEDRKTLYRMIRSNPAYNGLTHPMKFDEESGKYFPDFSYRYLTEDVPFGLVVYRGIAELVGVDTPVIDEVLMWSQKAIGKEYLVDGKLVGSDVKDSRAPQAFGFFDLAEIF